MSSNFLTFPLKFSISFQPWQAGTINVTLVPYVGEWFFFFKFYDQFLSGKGQKRNQQRTFIIFTTHLMMSKSTFLEYYFVEFVHRTCVARRKRGNLFSCTCVWQINLNCDLGRCLNFLPSCFVAIFTQPSILSQVWTQRGYNKLMTPVITWFLCLSHQPNV